MTSKIPALEERFLEPPGWRWHSFKREGRTIRFGTASPKDKIPDAVVICLPGLSEYGEKYFETAHTCLSLNLGFWVIDWMGQGKSGRYAKNTHKRHSTGFQHDVDDLHALILGYIKHSSVHPDVGRIPHVMLGHSMGANIGLHYLAKHPGTFECAGFTAPMLGLKVFERYPESLGLALAGSGSFIGDASYIPGFGNWREEVRSTPSRNFFSGDPIRNAVHNAWCLADPALQVGGITFGWLYQAAKSCAALTKNPVLESIQTYCLMALAGRENFVSNTAIRRAAAIMPHVKLLEFPDSRHEILMESEEIRKEFFNAFYEMIKDRIIKRPETLKPF